MQIYNSWRYDEVFVWSPFENQLSLDVMGIGLIITAVILGITDSAYSYICFAVCFVVGLSMLIVSGMKYNRRKA